ncbi:hypothetical protein B0O80DRAFT_433343 [Mortierella sp. GBAus27b]|nr:hypothetical protein B0O80DRAFT_433343 [Mortierella sp. GBAus27b]
MEIEPETTNKNQDPALSDPGLAELESLLNQVVDEQTSSLQENLSQVVQDLIESDQIELFEDLIENSIIPMLRSQSILGQQLQQFPKGVSRLSLLSSILNTFLPPIIVQVRADLRNIVIWLCSPSSIAHIDGSDANGDDAEARMDVISEGKTLVHPDGSVDLKAVWDPRVGSIALACLKSHWKEFSRELMALVWRRINQGEEFLIDELRAMVGLPRLAHVDSFTRMRSQTLSQKLGLQSKNGDTNEAITHGKMEQHQRGAGERTVTQPQEGPIDDFVAWLAKNVIDGVQAHLNKDINLSQADGDHASKPTGVYSSNQSGFSSNQDVGAKVTCGRVKEKVIQALEGLDLS